MNSIKAWLASSKWVIWALLAAIVGIVFLVLRSLFTDKGAGATPAPAIPASLQQKLDAAEEQSLKAKIKVATDDATIHAQVDTISKISSGEERRRQLAELLKNA